MSFVKKKIVRVTTTEPATLYYKDKECTILHREDGPAVECENGIKEWWVDGKLHRVDGPAVEMPNGECKYVKHGMLHRGDGPAYIHYDIDNQNYIEYFYIYGVLYEREKFFEILAKKRFGGFV